ncbi:helix-turn-helix domain-containing protein [Pontibacter diazotrophicus]|nr:helix-turn-helix transcriptional regulator [Pontibacter diazotrophicus]
MDDINTFGGRFKAFRKSRKLTGEDVGGKMRVLKTQISMIEHNKAMPPMEKMIEFAMLFPDLDLNWLLRGSGDMLVIEEQDKVDCWPLLEEEQEKLKVEKEKLEHVREKLRAEREKTEKLEELLIRHGVKTR